MDLDTTKNIAAIAAPLTKMVLETFLAPKLNILKDKWKKQNNLYDYAFEDKFREYLNDSYEKNAILNTIAFKKRKVLLNEVYVPLTLYCKDEGAFFQVKEFSEDIFENSNKILITDTAGMGKSTLARKLLISCIEQNGGVPILIELRRLIDNKDLVDEILEQLNPINETIDKQFILDLIKRGDFVFFLDGFDEISITERIRVTKEIQKFVTKARKNKFILTSRPDDALASFGDFQKFQIKPLQAEEAFDLIKRYDKTNEISKLLIAKIQENGIYRNIKEYLTTPLLVSLLFTAFEHKQRIPFKKHIFYRQVFDALFESHDLSKGDSFERDKFSGLGSDEFHRLLRIFGFLCLKRNNVIEFSKDELSRIIQNSIDYCSDLHVKPNDFIKDILITVPLFTKDGNYYKWSHKSLQEYFAAQFIYLDSKKRQSEMLNHISFHDDNVSYLNVIDLYRSMDPVGFESSVVFKLLTDYFDYLDNSYCNFEGEHKTERQKYTFGHEIFLINFPFSPRTKRTHPGELANLIRDKIKSTRPRISIGINVVNDEKSICNIKIPRIINSYQVLLEFLQLQGTDFIDENIEWFERRYKREQEIKENTKIELKLPLKKPYKVTDRKNSILNTEENFIKTNELIKLYLLKRNFPTINHEKGKITLNKLNREKRKEKCDDLLDF